MSTIVFLITFFVLVILDIVIIYKMALFEVELDYIRTMLEIEKLR